MRSLVGRKQGRIHYKPRLLIQHSPKYGWDSDIMFIPVAFPTEHENIIMENPITIFFMAPS